MSWWAKVVIIKIDQIVEKVVVDAQEVKHEGTQNHTGLLAKSPTDLIRVVSK